MKSDLTPPAGGSRDDDDASAFGDGDDAISLLTADHEDVKQMFEEFDELADDEADEEDRAELAERICLALTAHATVEEEIFYPAARAALEDDELLDEAEEEHASAKALIARIRGMSPSDEGFDDTVRELRDAVEHHVHEEEGELFPQVQEAGVDLMALGEQIAQRKDEVMAELAEEDDA